MMNAGCQKCICTGIDGCFRKFMHKIGRSVIEIGLRVAAGSVGGFMRMKRNQQEVRMLLALPNCFQDPRLLVVIYFVFHFADGA